MPSRRSATGRGSWAGGDAARGWAEQQCRAAGFEPDVRFEAADLVAHIRLIAAGHAVGVLPDLVWAGEAPRAARPAPGRPGPRGLRRDARLGADADGVRLVLDALRGASPPPPRSAQRSGGGGHTR